MALLLVLLVDELLLEGFPLVHLLLHPGLLLHDQFLLPFLYVLLMFHLLHAREFFAEGMRLSVLALLDEPLKDLLVLE